MRLNFIFKNKANNSSPDHLLQQQCQWPSCKQPKITNNSSFSNPSNEIMETPKACFSISTLEYTNISSESKDHYNYDFLKDESLETIIRGVQSSSSERLFFEPEQTKSISRNEIQFEGEILPFKESVVVVMASNDPYGDFKKSMQEMIESHGLKDLESWDKLLEWYLKMNDKKHHGFIVEAFIDMFLEFATSSSSNSTFTFFSSSILSRESR
ncbi:hypothetical protein Leryth_002625 [Lithospermum erythrorhizon]|nr:hypothetical protein Leryth_002625 [Lithospermum erythrorhizon]